MVIWYILYYEIVPLSKMCILLHRNVKGGNKFVDFPKILKCFILQIFKELHLRHWGHAERLELIVCFLLDSFADVSDNNLGEQPKPKSPPKSPFWPEFHLSCSQISPKPWGGWVHTFGLTFPQKKVFFFFNIWLNI